MKRCARGTAILPRACISRDSWAGPSRARFSRPSGRRFPSAIAPAPPPRELTSIFGQALPERISYSPSAQVYRISQSCKMGAFEPSVDGIRVKLTLMYVMCRDTSLSSSTPPTSI